MTDRAPVEHLVSTLSPVDQLRLQLMPAKYDHLRAACGDWRDGDRFVVCGTLLPIPPFCPACYRLANPGAAGPTPGPRPDLTGVGAYVTDLLEAS